jgi:metal-responsive CopG/Arc/MetJ family transcriptional regulator
MASVKTAVSIPKPLFEEVEALAERLGISRSRLYARALAEYVDHHENAQLLERINAAYAEPLDTEEEELLTRMSRYSARLVKEDK